jgi:hypothetical protein
MKQTAVEWLVDEMIQRKFFEKETELSYTTLEHLTNQAKQIEKQQIIDSHCNGQGTVIILDEAEEYYNETFNL